MQKNDEGRWNSQLLCQEESKEFSQMSTCPVTGQALRSCSGPICFLLDQKITNQYHHPSPCPLAKLYFLHGTGAVFVVPWPPSPSSSMVIADRDHTGHEEGPFTIWGSDALTKAQVRAKCENRRSTGLSLLLCGRATAGTDTLKTWPSPLDLTVALEDREGVAPCHWLLRLYW